MVTSVHHSHYERLCLAQSLIDRHYKTPLTIEQLSQEAGFSSYHFIRLFYRAFKQTPHQYLIRRRISEAKRLLNSTDLPVTEICTAVGFESLGSFSTLFRKATGLSPQLYRARAAKCVEHDGIPLCMAMLHGIYPPPDAQN